MKTLYSITQNNLNKKVYCCWISLFKLYNRVLSSIRVVQQCQNFLQNWRTYCKAVLYEKTAFYQSDKFSKLCSEYTKVVNKLQKLQLQEMLYENRFLYIFRGQSIWPHIKYLCIRCTYLFYGKNYYWLNYVIWLVGQRSRFCRNAL